MLVCLNSGSLAGYNENVGFNHCQCRQEQSVAGEALVVPIAGAPLLNNCSSDGQRLLRLLLFNIRNASLRGKSESTYYSGLAIQELVRSVLLVISYLPVRQLEFVLIIINLIVSLFILVIYLNVSTTFIIYSLVDVGVWCPDPVLQAKQDKLGDLRNEGYLLLTLLF